MYSQLLCKYQPRIIKTEEENEKFLEIVEHLLARTNLTPEESTILELLVNTIWDIWLFGRNYSGSDNYTYYFSCNLPRKHNIRKKITICSHTENNGTEISIANATYI